MRAGAILRALSERYRVSLLVAPHYPSPTSSLPPEIEERCQQVIVAGQDTPIPLPSSAAGHRVGWRLLAPWRSAGARDVARFRDEPFDVVHAFRLAMVESVGAWLDDPLVQPARHLDLDDIESISRHRIADRYEQAGQLDQARAERAAAALAAEAEAQALRRFDRIYVCSAADRAALEARRESDAHAAIELLPNAVPAASQITSPPTDEPFSFLFIGTLSYYPNEDAIASFCRESLPALRIMAMQPFRIMVVGIGAGPAVLSLADIPEVEVVGQVVSAADAYRQAHAVIVPVRAGGGTRIKIIEAFAHRRPVVTTSLGLEGIAAQHGTHVLVADAPTEFARQCARLIASPGLAHRLATEAVALHQSSYSLDALIQRVHGLPA